MEGYHILIVEDDKDIRDGIEIYLKNQGYSVSQAADGIEGLKAIESEEIHLAIVDIMMPRMDGITMMMKMREKGYDFPVIMLSAKSEEVDKIMGLNMGADDYVTKPFTTMELLARVNSHLRRYGRYLQAVGDKKENDKIHVIGGLELNEETVEVFVDGKPLQEDYTSERTYTAEGTEFPLTVPEGSVFVLGDNRNHSTDSRDARLGTVDERYIIGRAVYLAFPGPDAGTGIRNYGRIGGIG